MVLNQLQDQLAYLYEAPIDHNIADFLITDPRLADALTPHGHKHNDERLLLEEHQGELAVSVFVNEGTLDCLRDHDPFENLHDGNLSAYLLAIEGVSHFQYLCWNAAYEKSITLFELELQAEVDKYVSAMNLLRDQGDIPVPEAVHRRLFDAVKFHDGPDSIHTERYRDANRYAGKYCQCLSNKFPRHAEQTHFIAELRRFYRLPQNEKIRRIDRFEKASFSTH